MAAMNQVAAGGPVGGGMMMMNNNGSPAQAPNMGSAETKIQLNTYIYEYFLKIGHYDFARMLSKDERFEVRTGPKQSPGQRRAGDSNGDNGDGMDMDMKDDIPDDLPRPQNMDTTPGNGFLYEWFSIFYDLFSAHRGKNQNGPISTPAQQYLLQHQYMQRNRESQQNINLSRPGMVNPQMMRNPRQMVNGEMVRNMPANITPQQLQLMQNKQKQQIAMQQQMARGEAQEGEMNGRPGTPADGDNVGSPSKRPRLDGQQQFANGMMPNGRPGVPGVGPQGMMIQSGFQPNMNQAQFRQNGAMPQKGMPAGMGNGMMNMGGAGSPMMQNLSQFPENIQMEMYQQGRVPGQAMQGAPGGQTGNHALQDYQMQLMLLEQQNKKRLMMARQEQHESTPRDGTMQGVGIQATGMSPSGSRNGTSPNPTDQMKRTPQLGGLPGSPSAGDAMQGRSPAAMNFMNGMQPQDFNGAMFMKNDGTMMGAGGPPGMRPPTSAADMNAMARQQQQQQQQGRMNNQFQGGQPMAQQASQGGQQPLGTPGPRNEMPPPQAPAGGNSAQRNPQPASPANSNAPPTPSQANKANPKKKNAKEDAKQKRPTKKNSTANAPSSDDNPAATPTPSTPINNNGDRNFNASAGKGQTIQQSNQSGPQNPGLHNNPQQMGQDMGQPSYNEFTAPDTGFNLDFSTLENTDVLENFDFDSFLNTSADDTFNFDGSMGVDANLNFDTHE